MGRFGNEWLSEKCALLQDNPKRGKSAERYEDYKRARTLQQVMDLGGSRADIVNDVVRGYIMLDDKKKHKQLVAILNDKSGGREVEVESPVRPRRPPSTAPARSPSTETAKPPSSKPTQQKSAPRRTPKVEQPPEPTKPTLTPEQKERKRLVASTRARVHKFGRVVGRGRLLPYYSDD